MLHNPTHINKKCIIIKILPNNLTLQVAKTLARSERYSALELYIFHSHLYIDFTMCMRDLSYNTFSEIDFGR